MRLRDGTEWSAVNEAAFIPGTPASSATLVVSELHYQPQPPSGAAELAVATNRGDFEYVELMNIGPQTIDLGLVAFTDGIDFSIPLGTLLPNGTPNLLEHGLGGTETPTAQFQSLTVAGVPDTYFTYSFRQNLAADDVIFVVETSHNLESWQTLDATQLHSSTNNGDGTATRLWCVSIASPPTGQLFVRLSVTLR